MRIRQAKSPLGRHHLSTVFNWGEGQVRARSKPATAGCALKVRKIASQHCGVQKSVIVVQIHLLRFKHSQDLCPDKNNNLHKRNRN